MPRSPPPFTDPVRICISPYAPFTMHSSWADTNDGALEDDTLTRMTPLDTTISGDDTTLAGFDMDIRCGAGSACAERGTLSCPFFAASWSSGACSG
jgi:hypothetical protein